MESEMIYSKVLFILFIMMKSYFSLAADMNQSRKQIILKAFNQKSEQLIEPLVETDIELGKFDGRVNVNKKEKFSYYVQIVNPKDENSKIILIPMATSRFTPTYYQTDEWWDAHKAEIEQAKKNGTPMPKQDMDEVARWLTEMKLSTNPDVLEIDPVSKNIRRTSLNKYLLDVYLKNFVQNGKVVLYRGAERENELQSWKNGEAPKGARYWTPTANYAWRYARKNLDFIPLLVDGQTPLFRFEIPVEDFKNMVLRQWPRLTLGTELTKNAHQIFDRSKYFGDHLFSNSPYLGVGLYGVEFELRSNRAGLQEMIKYFVRPASVDDLIDDKIRILKLSKERLKDASLEIRVDADQRLQILEEERILLRKMAAGESVKDSQIPKGSEITRIDGFDFGEFVHSFKSIPKKCSGLFE